MEKIIEYDSTSEFLEKLAKFDICENPYQSYAFYSVFLDYFGGGKYRFFDVYDDEGKLLGIIPLQRYIKLFGVELLRFVGYGQFNYEQYICRNEDARMVHELFTDYIKTSRRRVIIDYYDINSSTPLYDLLRNNHFQKTVIQLYGCPLVNLDSDSFEDFFKTAFKEAKKRTELKKFQKRLESIGDIRIRNIKDKETYNQYKDYIPEMYRVFSERFADVYATSFFSEDSMRAYYDKLIQTLVEHEKGFVSLLTLDDTLIAFIFCLANNDTLIDWIPAFDPAFSKYNLGTVQYKMLFEEICANKDFQFFDFSKGSTVYKKKWSKDETLNYQFIVNFVPQNIIAASLYSIYKAFFLLKTRMRNNGMNDKIKHFLGSIKSSERKKTLKATEIVIEELEKPTNQKDFPYSKLLPLPVSARTEILNRMYSGWRLVDFTESNKSIVIQMSKTND